jgi:hypothetical protein
MRKLGLAIWMLGAVALLSMLLAPVEVLKPVGVNLSPMAFRALALINPLILMTVAVLVGSWTAPKMELDAPLVRSLIEGGEAGAVLRRQVVPALLAGSLSAVVLLGYGALTKAWFLGNVAAAAFDLPLITKMLYGGLVEEIMMRWGVMSMIAWLVWKLSGARTAALFFGVALAALLFGVGHLPALYTLMPSPPSGLVAMVLAANAVPGVLFGLLYWHRGLEAAMMAHALAHLLSTLALPLGQ